MPIGLVGGMLISSAVGAGASLYGASRASRASDRAADISEQANTEALTFEREKEARRQQEWDRMMADEEARWYAEQERLAPYRAASEGALSQLVSLAGLPAYTPKPLQKPDFNREMPEGWQPGDPTGVEETMAKGQTTIRPPTSSTLTDLLRDPDTLERVARVAAESANQPSAMASVSAPKTGVSDVAYQRLSDAGAAPVQALVRGRLSPRRRFYADEPA